MIASGECSCGDACDQPSAVNAPPPAVVGANATVVRRQRYRRPVTLPLRSLDAAIGRSSGIDGSPAATAVAVPSPAPLLPRLRCKAFGLTSLAAPLKMRCCSLARFTSVPSRS